MAKRKVKLPAGFEGTPIRLHYDADYNEYQVSIVGHPKATYFTDDKKDALSTAQVMRNTLLEKNPRDIHIDIGAHNVKRNPKSSQKWKYVVFQIHTAGAVRISTDICATTQKNIAAEIANTLNLRAQKGVVFRVKELA